MQDALKTHDCGRTEERRKAPRRPTRQQVTVRFTRDGHFEFTGVARDVSATGIFLHLDTGIEVGMEVELLLALPGEAGKFTMPIRGKVVRAEQSRPDAGSGIAIAFDRMEIAPSL